MKTVMQRLAAIVAVCLLFSMAALPTGAANDDVYLSTSQVTAKPGDEISVAFYYETDWDVYLLNGEIEVTFPTDKLSLNLPARVGPSDPANKMLHLSSGEVNANDAKNGKIIAAFMNTEGVNGSGALMTVPFVVKSNVQGSVQVKLKFTQLYKWDEDSWLGADVLEDGSVEVTATVTVAAPTTTTTKAPTTKQPTTTTKRPTTTTTKRPTTTVTRRPTTAPQLNSYPPHVYNPAETIDATDRVFCSPLIALYGNRDVTILTFTMPGGPRLLTEVPADGLLGVFVCGNDGAFNYVMPTNEWVTGADGTVSYVPVYAVGQNAAVYLAFEAAPSTAPPTAPTTSVTTTVTAEPTLPTATVPEVSVSPEKGGVNVGGIVGAVLGILLALLGLLAVVGVPLIVIAVIVIVIVVIVKKSKKKRQTPPSVKE